MLRKITNLFKDKIRNIRILEFLVSIRQLLRAAKYSVRYFRICRGINFLSDIQVISIEFCSVCNLNCRYCFLERKERPAFLSLDLYKKLLLEICEDREYQIKIMEWPISGCFFLHPQYMEIIALTKRCKDKYPNFRPWIILNDNMMLFDQETVDFVLSQGTVNQIICSIDGADKETFEYMRPNANFEKVLKNTDYLLRQNRKNKNRIAIQINNGRDARSHGRKLDSKLKEVFRHAALVTTWEPLDWNESFHKENPSYNPYPSFCSFVFESVCLSTSGAITKCCMDLKEATKYGDFNKDVLRSIWFSKERRIFLQEMYKGKRRLISGCNTCSINYVSQNKYP